MAGYIGGKVAVSSPQQIETKHTITATANQTSIPNIGYTVGAVHVYQNGVRLIDGTDFTATNGSTVTLETGATEGDQIVIVSHGSFETGDVVSKASGGTFAAAMNYPGGAVTGDVAFGDSNKILMGAGSDLQIYHNGSDSYVDDAGTGALILRGNTNVTIGKYTGETMGFFEADGAVFLYHNNAIKIQTTSTGIDVTGAITVGGAALGSGGMDFLASSGAISDGTASVIFNQFDASKYDYYIFNVLAVVPVTDNVQFLMQLSADGTNYDSTNGNYHEGTTDKTGLRVSANNVAGASGEVNGISAVTKLYNVSSTAAKTVLEGKGTYQDTDGKIISMTGVSNYEASAAAHTAVKFLFTSGNIESGEITMFGVVNS